LNGPVTWLYRALLAVCAPLFVLAALEVGLRLAGYGHSPSFLISDPDRPGCLRTNPAFANLFLPASFDLRPLNFRVAEQKAPNTLRVVILGESAAQGVPVPSFAFAPQLRAQLRACYPDKNIEIIDTGIVAINSHVIYRIARDTMVLKPDWFVVYAGNNEVVGPYGPGCAYLNRMPPLWMIRLSVALKASRTGQWLAAILAHVAARRSGTPEWGGMSMFVDSSVRGDDPRLASVYANFEANLQGIADAARACGAKTLFCTVAANWKDSAPFLSLHRPGLSPSELADWLRLENDGVLSWRLGRTDRARKSLAAALRIDDQYAETWYLLGQLDLATDISASRRELAAALHWDGLRFRPDVPINDAIRKVAGDDLLDLARLMGADPDSDQPIAGRGWFFEHVHFDWPGNAFIARQLAERISGRLAPLDDTACAAAVGYTAHERYEVLQQVEEIVRKPPFTAQLTYRDDQVRLARETALARRKSEDPSLQARAAQIVEKAWKADPDDADLAGLLEGIDSDRGDWVAALGDARRVEALMPAEAGLIDDEASVLVRLKRYDDARTALSRTADPSGAFAPVWTDYFEATQRWSEADAYFSDQFKAHPRDSSLHVLRAEELAASPAGAAAAREQYLHALALAPANQPALEGLVSMLASNGQTGPAAELSLARAPDQPQNQANDLRAVKACEAAKNEAGAIRWMEAAERCGPTDATFELTLALKLYQAGLHDEMMDRLAEAEVLARGEGNPSVTESIDRLIEKLK
jgi:hypothetical protein